MADLPRLSVVCITNGPTPMAAVALARVRALADEIVVAVDARVPPSELAPLDAVADRVVRAEYAEPFEANLAFLDSLATGDWILQLDDDDVVSDALLERLGTPGWDDGITHARLRYRWCWPASDHVLDESPWHQNRVLRLFRSTPGLRGYRGRTHTGRDVAGAGSTFIEPLYHLALLVESKDRRAEKAERYEREHPGLRTERGWALNGAFYLPEDLPGPLRTVTIPDADRVAIDRVVAAAAVSGPPTDPRATADREVVTLAARQERGSSPEDLRLRSLDPEPVVLVVGREARLVLGVTNDSERSFAPQDTPGIRFMARLFGASGAAIGFEVETTLPGPVSPGAEVVVDLVVPGLLPPAAYVFEVSVAGPEGTPSPVGLRIPIDVQPGRRILVIEDPRTAGAAEVVTTLLALALPEVLPVVAGYGAPMPEPWPQGFEGVIACGGAIARTQRRAARRADVPILDGSGWSVLDPGAVRATIDDVLGAGR